MAQVTFTTTNDEDAAVKFCADYWNARNGGSVSAGQFFQRHVRRFLDGCLEQFHEATKATKGELYQKASAADQAAVDAILEKYR